MAIRTDNLGGINWQVEEVLVTADLNDTMDSLFGVLRWQ